MYKISFFPFSSFSLRLDSASAIKIFPLRRKRISGIGYTLSEDNFYKCGKEEEI